MKTFGRKPSAVWRAASSWTNRFPKKAESLSEYAISMNNAFAAISFALAVNASFLLSVEYKSDSLLRKERWIQWNWVCEGVCAYVFSFDYTKRQINSMAAAEEENAKEKRIRSGAYFPRSVCPESRRSRGGICETIFIILLFERGLCDENETEPKNVSIICTHAYILRQCNRERFDYTG